MEKADQQNATTIAQQAVATTPADPKSASPATSAAPGAAAVVADPALESVAETTSFSDEDAKLAAALAEQAEVERKAQATGTVAQAGAPTGSAVAAPAGVVAPAATAASSGSPAAAVTGSATQQAQAASTNSQTAALIALRRKAQEERDGRLVAEGQARALQAVVESQQRQGGQPGSQQQAQAAEPTFEEQRGQIDKDIIALATDFEEGRLTASQWKAKEMELTKQRDALVVQEAAEVAAQNGAPSNNANDLGLEQHLTRLVAAFPILNKLTQADLEPFFNLAYKQAALQGVTIPDGAQGTVMLRERMAVMAEEFYDPTASAARKANAGKPAGTAVAQPGASAGGTAAAAGARPTAAQREAKLNVAANQPPDLGSIGSGAQAGEITEAQAAAALSGSEDQAIKWLERNPGFVSKVMGGKTQRA